MKAFASLDFNGGTLTNANVPTLPPGNTSTSPASTAFVAAATPPHVIVLFQDQTAFTSTATTAATALLLDASNYLWTTAHLPTGKSVYLEIIASATAGSPTVTLTALGSATALVTLVGTAGTAMTRTRSVALSLNSNTEYQVRLFNSVAGTASLKVARLIII